jgi:PAS domain S-box-containing protein
MASYWGSRFGTAIPALILGAAYCFAAVLGLHWALIGGAGSPVWPAGGVAVAGLLIGGQRLWPAIVVGRLLAGFVVGSEQPLWAEAGIALINGVSALVAVQFLERHSWFDRRLTRVTDIGLLVGASFIHAVVSATLGTLVLTISSGLGGVETVLLGLRWFSAQVVGSLTVTPAILAWWGGGRPLKTRDRLHFGLLLIAAVLVSAFVLIDATTPYLRQWHLYPLFIWAAVAFQVRGASAVLLIASGFAIAGVSAGVGPFVDIGTAAGDPLWLAQQFVALSSLIILLLAAALDERRHNEVLALALDSGQLAMCDVDVRSGKVLCSGRWAEMLGYAPEELPPVVASWTSLIHPEDQSRTTIALQDHLNGNSPYLSFEHRLKHKDGSWRWILSRGQVVTRDAQGRALRAVGTSTDITSQKNVEHHIAFLLREVNHRTKNLLSVALSIVRQTTPTAIAEELCSRLQGLAASQDMIVNGDWKEVGLHELVKSQLSSIIPHLEEVVTIAGMPLTIKPSAAQTIGMALHELATNAAKYGSLSEPGGRLDVRWSATETTFQLSWREHGGPRVTEPKRRHVVTTRAVEQGLTGEVALSFPPEGARWQLVCDLAKVASAIAPSPK